MRNKTEQKHKEDTGREKTRIQKQNKEKNLTVKEMGITKTSQKQEESDRARNGEQKRNKEKADRERNGEQNNTKTKRWIG